MKPNTLMIVTVALTLVYCINHVINLLPEEKIINTSDLSDATIEIKLPVISKTVVRQTDRLLVKKEKSNKKQQSAVRKQKVVQRENELKVDGKLLRLIGVFDSKSQRFAVVEQRDSESGKILEKVELMTNGQLGEYTVENVTINNVTLSNGDATLIFEMYKKPKLIKG